MGAPTGPAPTTLMRIGTKEEICTWDHPRMFEHAGVYIQQKRNGRFIVYKGEPGAKSTLWKSDFSGDKGNYCTILSSSGSMITKKVYDDGSQVKIYGTETVGGTGEYVFILSADMKTVEIRKDTPYGKLNWSGHTKLSPKYSKSPAKSPIKIEDDNDDGIVLMETKDVISSADGELFFPKAGVALRQKRNGKFVLYEVNASNYLWTSGYKAPAKGPHYTRLQDGNLATRPGSPDDNKKSDSVWKSDSGIDDEDDDYFLVLSNNHKKLSIRKGSKNGKIVWLVYTKAANRL